MPVTIQFPRTQYPSLQVGDIGYYAIMNTNEIEASNGEEVEVVATTGGFQTNNQDEDFVELGKITSIDNTTSLSDGTLTTSVTFDIQNNVEPPTIINYIFFAKNSKSSNGQGTNVNRSSLLGYFAKVKFTNNSTKKIEMFAASCEVDESSK
jgi:hypothetical protein|tara:strand:+ start:538 stop:990 length:453 start_codon:yes stop_codon:yes gene_type:complete